MTQLAPDPFAPREGDTDVAASHEEAASIYCQRLCERYPTLELRLRATLAQQMWMRHSYSDASFWAVSARTALDNIIGQVPAYFFPPWPRVAQAPRAPQLIRRDKSPDSDLRAAVRIYVARLIARFPLLEESLQNSLEYHLGLYESRYDKQMWARMALGAFNAKVSRAFPKVSLQSLPAWSDAVAEAAQDDIAVSEGIQEVDEQEESEEEAVAPVMNDHVYAPAEAPKVQLHTLAPRILSDVLDLRIEATSAATLIQPSLTRRVDSPLKGDMLLNELDASVRLRLSWLERDTLTEAICRVASSRLVTMPAVRERRLPPLPAHVELVQLGLRSHATKCLSEAGLATDLSPLNHWTIGHLLALPKLGARAFIEVLCALEFFALPTAEDELEEPEQGEDAVAPVSDDSVHFPVEAPRAQALALAPRILSDILELRIEETSAANLIGSRTDRRRSEPLFKRGMQLSELDASVASQLTWDERNILKEVLARVVSSRLAVSATIRGRRLPPLPDHLPLAHLELKPHAVKCLSKAGLTENLSPLSQWTIGDLFALPGLSVPSFIEILCAIETVALPADEALEEQPEEPEEELEEVEEPEEELEEEVEETEEQPEEPVDGLEELLKELGGAEDEPEERMLSSSSTSAAVASAPNALVPPRTHEEVEPVEFWHAHNERLGEILARVDDQSYALREEAHALAHAMHTGLDCAQSTQAIESMRKYLQDVTHALEELQLFANELEDGQALEPVLDESLSVEVARWTTLLFEVPAARAITRETFSVGEMVAAITVEGSSLGEKITVLATRVGDPLDVEPLAQRLFDLREKIELLSQATLEDELQAVLGAYMNTLSSRVTSENDVMASPAMKALGIKRRLGWDGRKLGTLQAVSEERRVSRERVRQVVDTFKKWFDTRSFFMPALGRTLSLIHDLLPGDAANIEAALREAGVLRGEFALEAVVDVAASFGLSAGFTVQPLEPQEEAPRLVWAVDGDAPASSHLSDLRRVWKVVTDHAEARGIGHAPALALEAAELSDGAEELARVLLDASERVRWLDRDAGWFWIEAGDPSGAANGQPNRLLDLVERTMSVARRLEVARLHAALERHLRRVTNRRQNSDGPDWEMPPLEVFEEWCHQVPTLRLESGQVEMENTPDPEEALSGVEREMVRVLCGARGSRESQSFSELGPPSQLLSRWRFQQACAARGVSRITYYAYVDGLSTIESFGEGIFGLTGASPADEEIVRASQENERVNPRVTLSCGHLPDGRAWMRCRVSQGIYDSGNCPCPAPLRPGLQGRFTLRDFSGTRVGTLAFSGAVGWGLGPLMRRRGQPGDELLLLVDLEQQEATVSLNNEALDSSMIAMTTLQDLP